MERTSTAQPLKAPGGRDAGLRVQRFVTASFRTEAADSQAEIFSWGWSVWLGIKKIRNRLSGSHLFFRTVPGTGKLPHNGLNDCEFKLPFC